MTTLRARAKSVPSLGVAGPRRPGAALYGDERGALDLSEIETAVADGPRVLWAARELFSRRPDGPRAAASRSRSERHGGGPSRASSLIARDDRERSHHELGHESDVMREEGKIRGGVTSPGDPTPPSTCNLGAQYSY